MALRQQQTDNTDARAEIKDALAAAR